MTTPLAPPPAESPHPLPEATWGPVVARLLAEGGTMTRDEEGGWELACILPNATSYELFQGVHDQLAWGNADGDEGRTALFDGSGSDVDDESSVRLQTSAAARVIVVTSSHWQAGDCYRVFAAATDEGFARALSRARRAIAEECGMADDGPSLEECAAYDAYGDAQEAAEAAQKAERGETP
jgi:hypothetical protein